MSLPPLGLLGSSGACLATTEPGGETMWLEELDEGTQYYRLTIKSQQENEDF